MTKLSLDKSCSLPSKSIGMFDSGVGGLTVMREVMKAVPRESIVYLGDTAHYPYGDKSRETIIRYSIENAIFLMEHNIKMLVVPCNTATAYALEKLRKIFNIPVIGVIEPGAEKAVQVSRNKRIAVLATRATVQSGMYQSEILKRLPGAEVFAVACPLFVPLVEEKWMHHPAARLVVKEYLHALREKRVDTVLLGCTHYPLLRPMIQEEVGADVAIVDSALTCAEKVAAVLDEHSLRAQSVQPAAHRYFVSDDPQKFQHLGCEILGMPIETVGTMSF